MYIYIIIFYLHLYTIAFEYRYFFFMQVTWYLELYILIPSRVLLSRRLLHWVLDTGFHFLHNPVLPRFFLAGKIVYDRDYLFFKFFILIEKFFDMRKFYLIVHITYIHLAFELSILLQYSFDYLHFYWIGILIHVYIVLALYLFK